MLIAIKNQGAEKREAAVKNNDHSKGKCQQSTLQLIYISGTGLVNAVMSGGGFVPGMITLTHERGTLFAPSRASISSLENIDQLKPGREKSDKEWQYFSLK